MPRKKAPKAPKSAAREFLDLLWWQAVVAIPFALFFGTMYGNGFSSYLGAYYVSLYFTYCIGVTIWAINHFVRPRMLGGAETRPGLMVQMMAVYAGASIAASFLAAWLIHVTIMPEFMGGPRSVAIIGMYSLLFAALFMGIGAAATFYRKALDRTRTDEELNLARRIQRSFLLSQFPARPKLEVHAVNVSSKQVSGDFYDVVPAAENVFLLAVADVAGKGVPAALLSSMLQASLRTQANQVPSTAAILRNINTLVYRSTSVHQFATFFLARVDEERLRLSYSNAGHNYPIVFRRDGRMETLERGGTVVGILEAAEFEEGEITLEPGDRVLFYTDGISEAANEKGELYGEERLCQLVAGFPPDLPAKETTERILEGVRDFLDGVEAGDDMTLMVLRVFEPGDSPTKAPVTSRPSA